MENQQELTQKYFKHNFTCHFLDGIMALAGFATLGINTITPGLIHEIAQRFPAILSIENRLAAATGVCLWGFSLLPGLFFTGFYETRAIRKPVFLRFVFASRVPFIFIAVITIFMMQIGYGYYLVLLYMSFIVFSFFVGAANPQWLDFIARQIPPNRRGILFGVRDSIGTLLGIAILATLPWISKRISFPYNYAIMYSFTAVFLFLSFVMISKIKEIPLSEKELKPRIPVFQKVKRDLSILKEDRKFRNLIFAFISASFISLGSVALFTMKGIRTLNLSGVETAQFTSILTILHTGSYAFSMPILGILADRWGYKRIACITYTLNFLCLLLGIIAKQQIAFFAAMVLLGFRMGGVVLVSINFPLEFAPKTRIPSYVAVKSFCSMSFIFMPFIGGWIADSLGYNIVFAIASIFAILTVLIYRFRVIDPRRERYIPSGIKPILHQ